MPAVASRHPSCVSTEGSVLVCGRRRVTREMEEAKCRAGELLFLLVAVNAGAPRFPIEVMVVVLLLLLVESVGLRVCRVSCEGGGREEVHMSARRSLRNVPSTTPPILYSQLTHCLRPMHPPTCPATSSHTLPALPHPATGRRRQKLGSGTTKRGQKANQAGRRVSKTHAPTILGKTPRTTPTHGEAPCKAASS